MDYVDLLELETALLTAHDVSHLVVKLRSVAVSPKLGESKEYAAGINAMATVAANVLTEMFGRAMKKGHGEQLLGAVAQRSYRVSPYR